MFVGRRGGMGVVGRRSGMGVVGRGEGDCDSLWCLLLFSFK